VSLSTSTSNKTSKFRPCEQRHQDLPAQTNNQCQRVECMSDHISTDNYNKQQQQQLLLLL